MAPTPPTPTDAELLRRARRDGDAFVVVYDRWAPSIHAWLLRRTGARSLAADLTAETFAQALLHAGRFRDEADGSAGPWLFGIAANLLRRSARTAEVETRARRRLGMATAVVAADPTEDAAARLDAQGTAATLRDALDELPPGQRQAVLLRVVDDLDYDEIARVERITNQAARLRVSRGLRRLRGRLERS